MWVFRVFFDWSLGVLSLPQEEAFLLASESLFLPLHPYIHKIALWKDLFAFFNVYCLITEHFYHMNLSIIKIWETSRFSVEWNMPFSPANSQALTSQHKSIDFIEVRYKMLIFFFFLILKAVQGPVLWT